MSTWRLVTCLNTVEKEKRLEEKLINNRLSTTLLVLVVAQTGGSGLKNAPDTQMVTMVAGGGKGVLFLTPSQGASSLLPTKPGRLMLQLLCHKTPLLSTANVRAPDLGWAARATLALSHNLVHHRQRDGSQDCFWCELTSLLSLKLQQGEMGRDLPPVLIASWNGEHSCFQEQVHSVLAGDSTTLWNIASKRNYVLSSMRLTCFIYTLNMYIDICIKYVFTYFKSIYIFIYILYLYIWNIYIKIKTCVSIGDCIMTSTPPAQCLPQF